MSKEKRVELFGVSFRTAPAAVREALAFKDQEAQEFLAAFRASHPDIEAAIISTCNRTEFYLAAPARVDVRSTLLLALRDYRPEAPILNKECYRYEKQGSEAVEALFRVACGIDSSILGDVHILGQLKKAKLNASEVGALGTYLEKSFTEAFRCAKRARSETSIGHGAASVGSAIASSVAAYLSDQKGTIVIVGAGDIARDVARHIAKRDLGALRICNRSVDKAKFLAEECGARATKLEALSTEASKAQVVITATSAKEPVMSKEFLLSIKEKRGVTPLLLIDAGMPRNIERVPFFQIIDIDAIREHQEEVLEKRRAAIPQVESIINNSVCSWEKWLQRQPLEQKIGKLYQNALSLSREVAENVSGKNLSPSETEQAVYRSFRHLLHEHVKELRKLASTQGS